MHQQAPIFPNLATERLTRRRVLQRVLIGLGAILARPLGAGAHPVLEHLNENALQDSAVHASAPDWSPEFLDAKQNEQLRAIAEQMLPGSAEAQVNRVIDHLLKADTAENQRDFLGSLAALDQESSKRFHGSVASLQSGQIDELLTACSSMKPERPAEHDDTFDSWKTNIVLRNGSPANLRDHFENLKGWIVATYYSSEKGLKELGWSDEFYFDSPEECEHPEGHS
jgi:hypothetical protein